MATQIAAQLYTLRNFTKTPDDIASTLKRCADIGFGAVQVSAIGPIEARELRKILDDNGLVCCATHRGIDAYRDQTQQVIDDHKTLGCKYTALGGYFPKAEEFSAASWTKFIDEFNAIAAKFRGSGVSLGYHNHSHEFANVDGAGTPTAWDLLFERLSKDAWMELDTYWVQHGGADPALWIERLKGRIPCVHLKDLGMTADRSQQMRPVGQGNLNWTRILAACRTANVEWYIIEQDNCNGLDPFDCLKVSLEFVQSQGVK